MNTTEGSEQLWFVKQFMKPLGRPGYTWATFDARCMLAFRTAVEQNVYNRSLCRWWRHGVKSEASVLNPSSYVQ